jgi:hypothetical protein
MPTENQPELAIAALQSEQAGRIASMSPLVAAAIEAAVDSQAPPRCSHFAQNLWVVLEDLDPLWLTSASGSRRLPRTQFALCTSNPTCDIAYSACHSFMRLCAAHPAQLSTLYMLRGGSPITEQTSGPDDRYGAGELMVTLATRSTAAGRGTMGSRQHSPTDTRGS